MRHLYNSQSRPPGKSRAPPAPDSVITTLSRCSRGLPVTPRGCPSHPVTAGQLPPSQVLRPEFGPQTPHSSPSRRGADRVKSQQETNDCRAALGIMAEARSRGRVLSHDPGQTRRFSLCQLGLRFQNPGQENDAALPGSARPPCHTPLRRRCPSPDLRLHVFDSHPFLWVLPC